jgi:hypothetical protein
MEFKANFKEVFSVSFMKIRKENKQMMNDNEENHTHKFFDNQIHYNFIRPHQELKGQTTAEVSGINLDLGENRVEDLMRQN